MTGISKTRFSKWFGTLIVLNKPQNGYKSLVEGRGRALRGAPLPVSPDPTLLTSVPLYFSVNYGVSFADKIVTQTFSLLPHRKIIVQHFILKPV